MGDHNKTVHFAGYKNGSIFEGKGKLHVYGGEVFLISDIPALDGREPYFWVKTRKLPFSYFLGKEGEEFSIDNGIIVII